MLALLLHAVALWAIQRSASRIPAKATRIPRAASDAEIDITLLQDDTGRAAANSSSSRSSSRGVTPEPTPVASPAAKSPQLESALRAHADDEAEGALHARPEENELPEQPDTREAPPAVGSSQPIDLGLGPGAWQRWVFAPEGQASRRDNGARGAPGRALFRMPPRSTTGGLEQGLAEQDRARGLGPSGRVISAFYRAAHDFAAPELGVARYRVSMLRTGAVEVSLGSFSGNGAGWRAVAARAREALRRSPPRLGTTGQGIRWLIEITADQAFPNGVKPAELHRARIEAVPPRFRAVDSSRAELERRNPTAGTSEQPLAETKANVELPGVYVSQRGKVCGYRIGISALGPLLQGGCDPSNAGASVQRRVHVRVQEQVVF